MWLRSTQYTPFLDRVTRLFPSAACGFFLIIRQHLRSCSTYFICMFIVTTIAREWNHSFLWKFPVKLSKSIFTSLFCTEGIVIWSEFWPIDEVCLLPKFPFKNVYVSSFITYIWSWWKTTRFSFFFYLLLCVIGSL